MEYREYGKTMDWSANKSIDAVDNPVYKQTPSWALEVWSIKELDKYAEDTSLDPDLGLVRFGLLNIY